jgi:isochorismate synthase
MKVQFDKINNHLAQKLPFVVYCKPNSSKVLGLLQQDDRLYSTSDFKESGFLFASFDGNLKAMIPEGLSDPIIFDKDFTPFNTKDSKIEHQNRSDKKNFEELVQSGIDAITSNNFKKVVLSRKETVSLNEFDLLGTFQRLLQLYPTAFVYCFFHPKIGTWLGATPEQLIQSNGKSFQTVSLAGTQKDLGVTPIKWQAKEQEEQQFVTDYIVDKLKNKVSDCMVSAPFNVKAGLVWHIKTTINAVFKIDTNLKQIVELLHPTPAVCGLPTEEAKAFILKKEGYNRKFYTGFLGELNSKDLNNASTSDLFVNLRCMEIEGNQAHIYIGCGITKDSIPEKEWEESLNKSVTMKRVLS